MNRNVEWVAFGGKVRETAHCTRCGEGLTLGPDSQPIAVWLAANRAFAELHSRCKPGIFCEPIPKTPSEWSRGRDTGISSGTIYTAATGDYSPWGKYDVPHDAADFGRCYRLLKLFPELRDSLPRTTSFALSGHISSRTGMN